MRQPHARPVDAFKEQIANVKRVLPVNGVLYPIYNGPDTRTSALTRQIQYSESVMISGFDSSVAKPLAGLLMQMLPNISKAEDYAAYYEAASKLMPKPMAMMDTSDENFGMQRITIKGFNLKVVCSAEDEYLPKDDKLTDANVAKICGYGVTLKNIRKRKQLFVQDFSDYAQWNDPEQVNNKYVPPVVGYFCYNKQQQKLLPLAIKVISLHNASSCITYTRFDSPGEWKLAKMALDAIDFDFQQMQHMVQTHAVSIPIRVELLRNMAQRHPVSALLMNHFKADIGLEAIASFLLFNTSTVMDLTFGFGATGALRFMDSQLHNTAYIKNDFVHDVHTRGLDYIPTHKFAVYGKLHYQNIADFVDQYIRAYYPSETAIAGDFELQNWAQACAQVPHLLDFPQKIQTYETLSRLLTHLVFQSTIKHHAMNGEATWHMFAIPFTGPALWKPMPSAKLKAGQSLDPLVFAMPKTLMPAAIAIAAGFDRPVPESESLYSAYKGSSFASESLLGHAIDEFVSALKDIDGFIAESEGGESWPYEILRPGRLPYYEWI